MNPVQLAVANARKVAVTPEEILESKSGRYVARVDASVAAYFSDLFKALKNQP